MSQQTTCFTCVLQNVQQMASSVCRTLLVTGARAWTYVVRLEKALEAFVEELVRDESGAQHSIGFILVHGGAKGADSIAAAYAKRVGWTFVACPVTPADWRKHGKKAGLLRNQQMIDDHKPDYAIAFIEGESRGSRDCIQRLKKYGKLRKNVRVIGDNSFLT